VGRFDADFLDVPREVIVLTMRTNQKYFACTNDAGALAPAFVCVANIDAKDGGEAIVEGNKRVLAARLADARFFWEQDLKVPLESFLPTARQDAVLRRHGQPARQGGADRQIVGGRICRKWFPESDPETAHRAGLLAKADLASAMAANFPSCRGSWAAITPSEPARNRARSRHSHSNTILPWKAASRPVSR
jgi:glycyl-tRNA synthetase beta chain